MRTIDITNLLNIIVFVKYLNNKNTIKAQIQKLYVLWIGDNDFQNDQAKLRLIHF